MGEFQVWFRTDADCLDYLESARMACRVRLPSMRQQWWLAARRWPFHVLRMRRPYIGDRGTIFDRTRTPLTVWFNACWLFAIGKNGMSALSLKRTLDIGSYQTAWEVLHRLRSMWCDRVGMA